jgi:hypothetical protein
MEKYKLYSFEKIYEESGFAQSFTLPDDCRKVIGLYFIPQFQGMLCPGNKAFLVGKVSVLLNNKNDNSLHDLAIMCYPDSNNKMSNGDNYSYAAKHIDLQTNIDKGNVVSVIFKDSGYMSGFINSEPENYAGYNPGLDVYLVYEDDRGDWSNNEFDKNLNKFLPND